MNFKKKTYRSKKYMDFVKRLECVAYRSGGCSGDWVAHHTASGGMAIKGSDLSCIPLCVMHHNEFHQYGIMRFEGDNAVELEKEVIKANQAYIEHLEGKK